MRPSARSSASRGGARRRPSTEREWPPLLLLVRPPSARPVGPMTMDASRRTVATNPGPRLSTASSSLIDLLRRTELDGEASSSFQRFSRSAPAL
ncbi:MAG: hypothetical protein BGO98_40760 [Myxococcales bacterium 68-20]|nr:MAG: hypothetical protein BGO98_40760 [Myxococcales bacterium 68-20]